MITRIGCGGFDIDNDTLIEEDGVLKVKNGGGGGGVFVVTMTFHEGDTETSESYWTADKTCLEIIEALEQGKNVYAVKVLDTIKRYYFLSYVYHEPGFMSEVFFSCTQFGYDESTGETALDMNGFKMYWYSDGTNSIEYEQYYSTLNS